MRTRNVSVPSRSALLCGALLIVASAASAQSVPGWASPAGLSDPSTEAFAPPPTLPPPPPPVPVDGGLSLLALAGAGYAAHRLRTRRAARR